MKFHFALGSSKTVESHDAFYISGLVLLQNLLFILSKTVFCCRIEVDPFCLDISIRTWWMYEAFLEMAGRKTLDC